MAYMPEERLTTQDMVKKLLPQVQQLRKSLDQDMISLKYLWTAIDEGTHPEEVEQALRLHTVADKLSCVEALLCRGPRRG